MATPAGAPGGARSIRPAFAGLLVALVVALGVIGAALLASVGSPATTGARPSATGGGTSTLSSGPASTPGSGESQTPPTLPPPTPAPTPQLVAAPLTGELVSPAAALQHPIAVMIDDHVLARPQSGFNAASVVWQAPAEGGIPRYMLIFQDRVPAAVGPVRSSREYFIEWASEWRALYVHAGGSPQALATLAANGRGQWVWNGEYFHWDGVYLWRVHTDGRVAPHNVFTDGPHLRAFAAQLGAKDGPITPAWSFNAGAAAQDRPDGTTLTVAYPYEAIQYRYDPVSNTYRRFIRSPSGGPFRPQVDAADGRQVAPANVVILRMAFGPLNDGHPNKHRLEASDVGRGVAWISSNGVTVKGTWRKASATAPTLLFGPDGQPVTLTAGQTFVQVMTLTDSISVRAGRMDPRPVSV